MWYSTPCFLAYGLSSLATESVVPYVRDGRKTVQWGGGRVCGSGGGEGKVVGDSSRIGSHEL